MAKRKTAGRKSTQQRAAQQNRRKPGKTLAAKAARKASRTATRKRTPKKAARTAAASPAARAAARKKAVRKPGLKKAAARKAAPKKTAPKKVAAKKVAARKVATTKVAARKAAARKAPVRKGAAKASAPKKLTAPKRSAAAKRTKQTLGRKAGKPQLDFLPQPVPTPPPAPAPKARAAKPKRKPRDNGRVGLDRAPIPSSLNFDRTASQARTGRDELIEQLEEHTETGPAITGGDIDANWEVAYSSGDEAPGGDNPTPDQDVVDDIGRALGVQYQDEEELKGADKISDRDKHRWELDPASAEDYPEH